MVYGPKIGLDAVYVAPLVSGTDTVLIAPSYGAAQKLASGIVKVTSNPNGALTTDWGDNGPFCVINSRGNLQLSLEIQDIDPDVLASLLGQSRANGLTLEDALDQSPWYAWAYRVWIAGSDPNSVDPNTGKIYEYFWHFKGKAALPTGGATTFKGKAAPEHTTLAIEFAKLNYNNKLTAKARTNAPGTAAALIANWFNAPVIATGANFSALSVAIAKSTTKITFTFSKSDASVFSMAEASAVLGQSIIIQGSGGEIAGTLAWTGEASASVVATFTPTTAMSGAVVATATPAIVDANGVALTPMTASLSF
jgi:phi13 family phage major tail protein